MVGELLADVPAEVRVADGVAADQHAPELDLAFLARLAERVATGGQLDQVVERGHRARDGGDLLHDGASSRARAPSGKPICQDRVGSDTNGGSPPRGARARPGGDACTGARGRRCSQRPDRMGATARATGPSSSRATAPAARSATCWATASTPAPASSPPPATASPTTGNAGLEDRVFVAHLLGGRAGTQEQLLGAGEHAGFRISDWSPDATRILYYYEDDLGRDDIPAQHLLNLVYTVPPLGSAPFLTAPAFVPFAGGSFFPDSRTVAVSARLRLPGASLPGFLLRVNTATAHVDPIATDTKLDGVDGTPRDPAVSPDGSKIAYSLDGPPGAFGADDLASLVVINADGSGRHVLTRGHRDTRPQWSPDGRMLTFQRQTVLQRDCGSSGACYYEYEVFVIGADGSGEANFSNAPPYNFAPDWRPARPRAETHDGAARDGADERREPAAPEGQDAVAAGRVPEGTAQLRRCDQAARRQARRAEEALPAARRPVARAARACEAEAAAHAGADRPPARHEGEGPAGPDAAGAAQAPVGLERCLPRDGPGGRHAAVPGTPASSWQEPGARPARPPRERHDRSGARRDGQDGGERELRADDRAGDRRAVDDHRGLAGRHEGVRPRDRLHVRAARAAGGADLQPR